MKLFAVEQIRLFIEALLRVEDVPGSKILVLPLAYSIASIVGAVVLVMFFERRFGGFVSGVTRAFGESLAAASVAGLVSYGTLSVLGGITEATTLLIVLLHGFVAGMLGIISAALLFWFSGNREFLEIVRVARNRYHARTTFSGESEL